MLFYGETFLAALFLSALFAMGGVGSAIVLIPLLHFLGVGFDLAKAVGLFVNTMTTSTASLINYRRNVLDVKFCLPFLITSVLFAPIGAFCTTWVDLFFIKLFFALFLIFFSLFMVLNRKGYYGWRFSPGIWLMGGLGMFAGFFAGLLGVGGSLFIIPALSLSNIGAKKIAIMTSFMIPLGTFPAFLSYCFLIDIDWVLVFTTAVAAIIGGYTGTQIMHLKINNLRMQFLLAGLIFAIGLSMTCSLLFGI